MKIILKCSIVAFFLSIAQFTFAGSFIDSATVVSVDKVYKQVRVEEPYQECYIKETVQNNGDGSATNEIIGGVIGGAIGNIIDSSFYGIIFNESYNNVASFMPDSGGYSSLLHGKVVDMFYFPLMNSHFPNWLPIWGGEHFIFFRPVFNIADAGISIGIFMILLFYRKEFN